MTSRARSEHTSQRAGRSPDGAREPAVEAGLERGLGLQRAIGNQAVIQRIRRRGGGEPGAGRAAIHDIAAAGVSGPARPLPHLAEIQTSFGRHDVSRVRAHTDGVARAGTTAIGAAAYATGEHVAFSRAPDLFMAAHEAAHVVQQRAGVQLSGGVGEAGDRHERHADAVARLVVENKSAESLLGGHGGGGRGGGVQRSVQFWGEPDHYMLGQAAGVKTREVLDQSAPMDTSYRLGDEEEDLSKPEVYEADDTGIKVAEDDPGKLFLRDKDGNPISYGAANRFGGDFSAAPFGKHARGVALDAWPAKVKAKVAEERSKRGYDAEKSRGEYADLKGWEEKGLMATNANHFYPLSGVEYRRQHQIAKQKVWMAITLRGRAQGKPESEAQADLDAAAELARQATIAEGFASHFLADAFAAGHLAPHALGRVDAKDNMAKVGAKVNTWHDVFNALPDGIPTTLGRFHGDYSMDGHDLEYVSSVIANSLLEIMMPWYAGRTFEPNIVLPAPDVPAIRADPVAGPLWRQMCGDYQPDLDRLRDVKRRPKKSGLSKYAIYQTTSDQQVSNAEVIAPILANVYGEGRGGLERVDDTGGDRSKIRGKIAAILAALDQILEYRGGWQPATGRTQKFELTDESRQTTYKFNPDLVSAQMASLTPATPPIIPLCEELEYWQGQWIEANRVGEAGLDERRASVALALVIDLSNAATGVSFLGKAATFDRLRKTYQKHVRRSVADLEVLGYTRAAPIEKVEQGPDVAAPDVGASVEPVAPKADFDEILFKRHIGAWATFQQLRDGLNSLAADPRPVDDGEHRLLYELVGAAAADFKAELTKAAKDDVPEKAELKLAIAWCDLLREKLTQWRAADGGALTKLETARRDVLADMKEALPPYCVLDYDRLARATARVIEG